MRRKQQRRMLLYYLVNYPALLLRRRMRQWILRRQRWMRLRQQQLPVDYPSALLLRRQRQWIRRRILLLILSRKVSFLHPKGRSRCNAPAPSFSFNIKDPLLLRYFASTNCPTSSSKIVAWADNSSLVAEASSAVAALL